MRAASPADYPIGLETIPLLGEDRFSYHQRLLEDSPRLFKAENDIEVFLSLEKADCAQRIRLGHISAICSFLEKLPISQSNLLYVFRQDYSWDQFSITLEALQTLLDCHQVFAPFLDCLHSFGFKTCEDDNVWNGFRHSISRRTGRQLPEEVHHEFCYAVRYVARNGRSTGSPWSLRQTAVYQQYNTSTNNTIWIFLQPSTDMQRRYTDIQPSLPPSYHPAALHVVLLFAIVADWKDYIAYLRQEVDTLDQKACFSRLGRNYKHDYTVSFEDSQRLQNLRERLLRTLNVLDAHLEVVEGCMEYCRSLSGRMSDANEGDLLLELAALASQLRTYRRAVVAILDRSQGTLELLFKMLEYRNDENLTRKGIALHKDIEMLRDIANHSKRENETLVRLAAQSRKDGRSLKALSVLGTLYLPATFIATIFSSSLVQSQQANAPETNTHFIIARQFWLFIVLTVPLMLLTAGYMIWVERR